MEENVALDSASQSSFRKAIKNVKKLIKKGTVKVKDTGVKYEKKASKFQKVAIAGEGTGTVYLTHIPHGFFEEQMKGYFSQFGRVTKVHLARSHRTGKSKGFAFIEFLHASVAKIAAETMNNYLMRNRLLQAKYLENPTLHDRTKPFNPPTPETCRTALNRNKNLRRKNCILTPLREAKAKSQEKRKLRAIKEKLKRMNGIDLDFEIEQGSLLANESENNQDLEEDERELESNADSESGAAVLELDESDTEITFNPPPGMIVKRVNRSKKATTNTKKLAAKRS